MEHFPKTPPNDIVCLVTTSYSVVYLWYNSLWNYVCPSLVCGYGNGDLNIHGYSSLTPIPIVQCPQLFLQFSNIYRGLFLHSSLSRLAHSGHLSFLSSQTSGLGWYGNSSPPGVIKRPSFDGPLHFFEYFNGHHSSGQVGSFIPVPTISNGISNFVVGSTIQ